MNLSVYPNALSKFNASAPWLKSLLLFLFFLGTHQATFGQCNPTGNISRYEFNIDPTSNINLAGQEFCTSQSMGNGCCGQQGSYRCLDIILNLDEGPNGEQFSPNCGGSFTLRTEQGNFDALFVNIGVPNPNGGNTDCNAPINIGNNYDIIVSFNGNAMGDVDVSLTVKDNMGVTVYTAMETGATGESVIFTICKPGFGCVGDELVFGCCSILGTLALAPGAPSTICEGESSSLKVVASGGTAPYMATIRCDAGMTTTFFTVNIPNDGDGNSTMDMLTFPVSPTGNTDCTYSLISLSDATGCVEAILSQTVTINVNAVTGGSVEDDQVVCPGGDPTVIEENTASSGDGTLTYRWESSTTMDCETGFATIAGAEAITYDPPSGLVQSTTYRRVTISTLNGVACEAYSNCVTVTVNPVAVVDPIANQTYCSGSSVPSIVLSSNNPDAVISWTRTNVAIGLVATNGTGNIPSFTATNAGNTAISSVFTVVASLTTDGLTCPGAPVQFTLTVNPVPQVNAVANQTYCVGVPAPSVVFASNVANATFAWSRTNEAIGLGATNGTGNIPAFTTTNSGTTALTSTFSVVASYSNNGVVCSGAPIQFSVTVNPTPTVVQPDNQVLCNGNFTNAVAFTGAVTSTVYNWTNNTPSIGLAANGSGNIDAFSAVNNGNVPVTATITVTPTFTGSGVPCQGTPSVFTITVNPAPSATPIQNISTCNGQTVPVTVVTGPVAGATYAWTNNNTSIGLAANGTGNIPSFVAVNNTANPAVATIIVTPTYSNAGITCQGSPYTFTITVNTNPTANAGADQFVCQGASAQLNGSGGISCLWTPGTGLSNSNVCNPTASPNTTTTYFLTVTNQNGCTDTDEVVVKIHVPESLACNDNVQISLDENGTAEILPDHILEGTYELQFYTVMITTPNGLPVNNPVTCANIGQLLVVKVIDNCNGNSCWGSITVEDNLSPTLDCEDVVTNCAVTNTAPAYLDGVLGLDNVYPDADDNCSISLLTYADTWFDLGCNQGFNGFDDLSGYIRRVWTAQDPSGNQASCTQYIYLERIHVYDVSFPNDITVSCESPTTNPSVTGAPFYVNPDFPGQTFPLYPDDANCELSILYTDQLLPVCDGTYQILRTWTVYDGCLPTTPFPPYVNPMYHIQVIQVLDDQGPTFTCPADITVGTNTTDCERDLNLPDVIIEDACSSISSITAEFKVNGVTYTINGTLTNFPGNNLWAPDTLGVVGIANNLPLGTTEVKYIVTDNCGNSTVCTFDVTVEDQTPPAAICDEFTQVSLGSNGMVFINASTFDDGSYDNCSPVEFKVRRMDSNSCQDVNKFHDQVKFCCSDIGNTITVILRVYDVDVPAGDVDLSFEEDHSNDCMVQVLVEDKLKPICQAPANVTVSCENFDPSLWAYGTATATDNCCVEDITVFNILTNFDTTCNKGTITRRWTVEDCAGLTSTCTQRIVVNYEQDYFIRFPVDKLLFSCDSSFYQEPALLGEDCELLAISYHDEVFTVVPDACFKIERTWTIINWCTYNPNLPCIYVPNPNPNPNINSPQNLMGPTVSAPGTTGLWTPSLMKINPTDPVATDYSTFWDPNANCYTYKQIIKVSDNIDPVFANCPVSPVEVCDLTTNHTQLWNETYWFDAATGLNDLCEAPTDLAITASDACSNQLKFRYLLFLDLDNSGDMETVINSANLPGYNTVPFNNANNPNFSGGTPRSFDERNVPFNQKYGFTIQTVDNGGSVTASVKWNTIQSPNNYVVPEFPYGTHKIKWIAEDQCGNEKICEYTFVVKDCKAPTVVCLNGLSVNIMPTQMISLWASDFLQHLEDNCTPTDQITLGIRRKGAGLGFPTNPDGTPQTEVNFTCADLGTQFVELWGMDLAGNADYCETYVLVQDNQGFCSNDHVTVAGEVTTENQTALQDAEVELNGSHPALPPINMFDQTGNDGSFVFSNNIPVAADYSVTPTLDVDHLNGVSTFDLVLINKHILGIETFGSPFKIIAADANNSKSVTTFDIAELRKLILGIYTELPQNTSWRFVDAAYTFPTPDNPFAPAFPESKSMAAVQSNQLNNDFVAVKIGDVNQSAIANNLMTADDRTMGTLLFDLKDQQVQEGEEVVVNFNASEKVLGYQFTLLLHGLEVKNILPGAGMTMQNFGVFEHAITTSFDSDVQGEFTVVFRAVQSGSLRNMLGISGSITPSEAYALNGDKQEVALRYNGSEVQGIGFELYQNQPNPFVSNTAIGFYLPEAGEVTLTVFDESGRQVYVEEGDFGKGHNTITLDRSQVDAPGLLYYKLSSGENSATMKMIQIK